MKTQKQQRLYGILVAITVVLLLVAQFLLQYALKGTSRELVAAKDNLLMLRQSINSKTSLVEKYKQFEIVVSNPNAPERGYPQNGSELYAILDKSLGDNGVDHSNTSPTSGTPPGGELRLQITFNGSYYSVLKALAAMRESPIVMRISAFRIDATNEGQVSGTMTVLSTAKS
jgi:hypothetical protein